MLTVETIGRIRREHFIKGKTIREISRDLKVSRNTARKVLRSGETSFEYERDVQPRPKPGRWDSKSGVCHARGFRSVRKENCGHHIDVVRSLLCTTTPRIMPAKNIATIVKISTP